MSLLDAFLLDPHPFEVWIAYRTDGIKGSGTASDPFNGSTQALFDAVMAAMPANSCIRLGPSPKDAAGNPLPFLTNGYDTEAGWSARAGMRIVGSGIDVTILKLVTPGGGVAIGHAMGSASRVDGFVVSDLTIDCNLTAGPPSAVCRAIQLMGDRVRIRRVKAIHWGANFAAPCQVFSLSTFDANGDQSETTDAGIEDCVAVQPASANAGSVVVLNVGGRNQCRPFARATASARSSAVATSIAAWLCRIRVPESISGSAWVGATAASLKTTKSTTPTWPVLTRSPAPSATSSCGTMSFGMSEPESSCDSELWAAPP